MTGTVALVLSLEYTLAEQVLVSSIHVIITTFLKYIRIHSYTVIQTEVHTE